MNNQFIRSEILLGYDKIEKLKNTKVTVVGIGGVGSYVLEGLARSGIGSFILIDDDIVAESNINRQIIALNSTIGKSKVSVAKQRVLDINNCADVKTYETFYGQGKGTNIIDSCDYVVDAIDTVTSKLELISEATNKGIPIISCMGTGNKLNPLKLRVSDIYKTKTCPLCRVIRRELKTRGIKKLKVVYSEEQPIKPLEPHNEEEHNVHKKRKTVGSVSFVPSVAGMIICSEVVKDILNIKPED